MLQDQKYSVESKGPPGSTTSAGQVSLGTPAKRLLREIAATIECVLAANWMTFVISLGYSDDDVGSSYTEPTSKIFKILLVTAAQHHGDTERWWEHFLQQLTSFGNAELTSQIHDVYNKWKDTQSQSSSFDKIYPALQSNLSFPSEISNESHHHEENNDIDRPEISMEINVVAEALDRVADNPATAGLTKWLRDGVPRIIQLERELKSQKTLRGIFENESHDLKSRIDEQRTEIDELKQTNDHLLAEIEELKKAKQDEQLKEFDYVTRKEAQDIKDEEKVRKLEKQRSAPEGDTPEAVKEEILKLKKENTSLKKQIDEIVKVNHSWDEHYRKMKTQLEKQTIDLRKEVDGLIAVRNENEQLKAELARLQQELQNHHKEKDALLLQAKERIERAEKEKSEKQKEAEVVRQKFDKVQGYARTLTNQRKEAEAEISRLNEALAQKLTIAPPSKDYHQRSTAEIQQRQSPQVPSQSAKTPATEPLYESIPPSMESLLANSLARPQKRVESMTEAELRGELELLRQQTDVYRSDFNHERQDRQRVMGELDETKKELKRYQRDLKGQRSQAIGSKEKQVLQDEQYAQQLQRQEEAMQRPAYPYKPMPQQQQMVQPRYQPQQRPQRRPQPQYNYYTVEDIQAMQLPQKGLVPHGGGGYGPGPGYYYGPSRNYAANDMMIDGVDGGIGTDVIDGELEIDGMPDEGPQGNDQNPEDMTCPRCKRSFSVEGEYTTHKDRCVTD